MRAAATYSLKHFGKMIGDRTRTNAYYSALQRVITKDSVVVDIGAGPGIFSLLACQLGAKKVYAIEPDDSILMARELANRNGFSDRIEFIQDMSTQVELKEKVDVIVSDLHGLLPQYDMHIPSIIDARDRLLKPGGVMIPAMDRQFIAVLQSEKAYLGCVEPWARNDYGLDLSPMGDRLRNFVHLYEPGSASLITKRGMLAELDYLNIDSPHLTQKLTLKVETAGYGHGWVLWFDSLICQGVSFSNAPDKAPLVYRNAFLPWEEPIQLAVGDAVNIDLQAKLIGSHYIWKWDTEIHSQAGVRRYSQSNFQGALISSKNFLDPSPVGKSPVD